MQCERQDDYFEKDLKLYLHYKFLRNQQSHHVFFLNPKRT